jgi:hypothetical protein
MTVVIPIAEAGNRVKGIGKKRAKQSCRWLMVVAGKKSCGPGCFANPPGSNHEAAVQLKGFVMGPG